VAALVELGRNRFEEPNMRARELVEELFGDRVHPFDGIVGRWVDCSARFAEFIRNHPKILARLEKAKNDDGNLAGVLAELEMAYLLLQNERFSVEYEHRYEQPRGPDLTVTDRSTETDSYKEIFNVEVKRIRKRDLQKRLELWKAQTGNQVRQRVGRVPSTLAVSIDIDIDLDDLMRPVDWLDRLEYATSDIIDYIIETLRKAEGDVPSGKAVRYPVPCFDGVKVVLSNPLRPPDHVSYYGVSHTVLSTRREYRDFGDVICDKLGQMIPGMTNVLAVSTDSATHDAHSLEKAIESLKERARHGDNEFFKQKGLEGADDYIEKVTRLSGVLVRSIWAPLCAKDERNLLCCNKDAEHSIPEDIRRILRRMDY
jgi:hypothetical protein